MSRDDAMRSWAQNEMNNHPNTQNQTEQQVKDHHDRQVINNELERLRKENDERR
jgi:hypothetical protein